MLETTAISGGYAVDYGTRDVTPVRVLKTPTLRQIKQAQDYIGGLPQVQCPVRHLFSPGQYTRECSIAAGNVVVGKMHRHQHPTFLMQGTCRINTDQGMQEVTAPHIWISQPNAKRILLTLTDCVFATVHLNPTDTQDLDAIEADVIVHESLIDYDEPALAAELKELCA